eukprot:m.962348 g.962348  ORF g.962348 m.962348 type:complete len:1268 (+) comp23890_c0_seq1:180-3983(+)
MEASAAHQDTILVRVSIQEHNVQKCLLFDRTATVWTAKQLVLDKLAKDLTDAINYGLYIPPTNGRAGKFLAEERLLGDYALAGPVASLDFKYKRRVYPTTLPVDKARVKLHGKSSLKRVCDLISKGGVAKIADMIGKGLDPNFQDEGSGETPLTIAVAHDRTEMITTLVEGGAHMDFRAKDGLTPLHKAAVTGMHRSLSSLLDLGASPDLRDATGLTPLYLACMHSGTDRCTELLLKDKAQVNVVDRNGWAELHQAAKFGHDRLIHLLGLYGADVNMQNSVGNTPLHVAATWDQPASIAALLQHGAARDAINLSQQTPLAMATISGAAGAVAALMQTDASSTPAASDRVAPHYVERHRTGSVEARHLATRGGRTVEAPAANGHTASVPTLDRQSNASPATASAAPQVAPQVTLERRVLKFSKGPNGYGFRVQGAAGSAADQHADGQIVSQSDVGGPAHAAGLRVGDRLVSVNGIDVMYASHQRVVDLVRLTKGTQLVLVVGASGKSPLSTPMLTHRDTNIDSGQIVPLMFSPDLHAPARPSALPAVRELPHAPAPPPPPPAASPAVLSMAAARQSQGSAPASPTARAAGAPPPQDRPAAGLGAVLQGLGSVRLKRTAPPVVRSGAAVGRVLESEAAPVAASPPLQRRASGPVRTAPADPLAGILNVKLKKTPSASRKEFPVTNGASHASPGVAGGNTPTARRVASGPPANSAGTTAARTATNTAATPAPVPSHGGATDTVRGRARSVGPPVVKPKPPPVTPRRTAAPPTRKPPDLASLPPDFHAAYIVPHPRSVTADTSFGAADDDGVMVPPPPPPPGFWAGDHDTPAGEPTAHADHHLFIPPPPMDFGHVETGDSALNSIDFLPPMPSPGPDDASHAPAFDVGFPPPPPPPPVIHVPPPAPVLISDASEGSDGYIDVSAASSASPVPVAGASVVARSPTPEAVALVVPAFASARSSYSVLSTSDSSDSDSDEDISGFDAVPGMSNEAVAREAVQHTQQSQATTTTVRGRHHRAPPPPPKNVAPSLGRMAISAFAFAARNEDELSFDPGMRLELLETPTTGGWWKGRIGTTEGWFPNNHVRELVSPPAASKLPARRSSKLVRSKSLSAVSAKILKDELERKRAQDAMNSNLSRSNSFSARVAANANAVPRSIDDCTIPDKTVSPTLSAMQRFSKSDCDLTTLLKNVTPAKPPKEWTCTDVGDWLDSIGLGAYRSIFMENEIKGSHLLDLDKADLKELNVNLLGHRLTMFKSIKVLRAQQDADDEFEF